MKRGALRYEDSVDASWAVVQLGAPNKAPSSIEPICEPHSFLNPSSSPRSLSDLGVQTFSNSQHDNEILGAVPERYSPAENFMSHPAQVVKLRNLCRATLFATEPLWVHPSMHAEFFWIFGGRISLYNVSSVTSMKAWIFPT